jgi:hypothetical protein
LHLRRIGYRCAESKIAFRFSTRKSRPRSQSRNEAAFFALHPDRGFWVVQASLQKVLEHVPAFSVVLMSDYISRKRGHFVLRSDFKEVLLA